MQVDIFSYINPEDLVTITLEGIDKDLRLLDSLFLFVTIISAYLFIPYIPYFKLKYFSKKNNSALPSSYSDDYNELNILGFKISRKQLIYITVITTLIHVSLGITIRSKTNLIIEISDNVSKSIKTSVLNNNPQALDSSEKADTAIKRLIAENYAFQSLSNSKLFQMFNYKKMYLTRKTDSFNILEAFSFFVLFIPFLLFTFFFLIVGFEWLTKVSQKPKHDKNLISKAILVFIIYLMNIYSFYLWVGGIKNVAGIINFNYELFF